jgi:hypothetical protein
MMRQRAYISSMLIIVAALAACSSYDTDNAKRCGVTEEQLRSGIDQVSEKKPYSGEKLGRCELIVDDARNVLIITPDIKRSVENMIAREKAGSKN